MPEVALEKKALSPGQQEFPSAIAPYLLGGALAGGGAASILGLYDMLKRNLGEGPIKRPKPMIMNIPYKVRQLPDDEAPAPAKVADFRPFDAGWWIGSDAQHASDIPLMQTAKFLGTPAATLGSYKLVDSFLRRRMNSQKAKELEQEQDRLHKAELGQFKPVELQKLSSDCAAILAGDKPADPAMVKAAEALDKLSEKVAEGPDAWHKTGPQSPLGGDLRRFNVYPPSKPLIGPAARMSRPAPQQQQPELIPPPAPPGIQLGPLVAPVGPKSAALEGNEWYWPWNWVTALPGGTEWRNTLARAYPVGAAVLGGGAGALAYNYARHTDPERQKAKAIQEQLDQQARSRPPELFARLMPVKDDRPLTPKEERKAHPDMLAPGSFKESADASLEERARGFVIRLLKRE